MKRASLIKVSLLAKWRAHFRDSVLETQRDHGSLKLTKPLPIERINLLKCSHKDMKLAISKISCDSGFQKKVVFGDPFHQVRYETQTAYYAFDLYLFFGNRNNSSVVFSSSPFSRLYMYIYIYSFFGCNFVHSLKKH